MCYFQAFNYTDLYSRLLVSCDFDNAINPMCHWNSSIDGVYNHMKFKVGQFLVGGSSGKYKKLITTLKWQ